MQYHRPRLIAPGLIGAASCLITAATGLIATASHVRGAEPTKEQLDYFEQKIRPILAENCYSCHSIEQGKSKGNFTLDTIDGIRKGGDTGPGIVPGNIEGSLVYNAISYKDKDLQMPPTSKGGKLKDAEVAAIADWIKMGAPDPRKEPTKSGKLTGLTDKARAHWAYQPVKDWKSIPIPTVANRSWLITPIDAFILIKLEEKGMSPSPDAEKETRLRRAYFDLIGMPPSPAEVWDYVYDKSPNAWEKVVDRLLASPHYGERWGRHWLDTARYADTIGGDGNTNNGRTDYRYAHAWTYRDYVIRAFNEDLPYNQFIIEQLAADYLHPLQPDGKSAPTPKKQSQAPAKTTFVPDPLNLGKKNPALAKAAASAPASPAKDAPQAEMMSGETMVSMMTGGNSDTVAGPKTVGDPSLAALGFLTVGERFNNNNDIINDRIDTVSKGFLGLTVACARCHDHMFDPISMKDYYALHGVFSSISEPTEKPLISSPDPAVRKDYETQKAAIEAENRDIYFREVEHWLSLWQSKPQDYLQAAYLRERGGEKAQQDREKLIKDQQLDGPLANFYGRLFREENRVYGPIRKLMEVKKSEFDTHAPLVIKDIAGCGRYNPIVADALKAAKPGSMEQVIGVYNNLLTRLAPKINGLVKSLQSSTTDKIEGISSDEFEILRGPFELTAGSKADTNWIRMATNGWPNQFTGRAKFVFAKLNELDLTHAGAPARAMVVQDRDRPRDSNVLLRGQSQTPGERVPRRFIEILSPHHEAKPFKQGSGRLELAQAIANKDNPLTARVIVNRVWMYHFGDGFVRTPDDLGTMSEPPSHPELLDYLASWFMDEKGGNWSLKRLHKFIMLSRTYFVSSHTRDEYAARDPDNRLLWRANVRRLDFESIRDSLLVFSGRLEPKIGGQPVNITDEPYVYRRSIYGYIDRGNLPELMGHFDFSDPDMPNSRRATTVVPQQALFLMNSPMAIDVARRVIKRPEFRKADTDQRRVFALYSILFQRQPSPAELVLGYTFLAKETKAQPEVDAMAPEFAKRADSVAKRIEERRKRDNDAKRPVQNDGEIIDRKPLNVWESYAHALLFSNEMAYVN